MITENNIPKKFKIANQWYTVEMVDHLNDGDFGDFDSIRTKIRLAKRIYSVDEYVELSEEQICNSFWHEVS